MELMTSSVSEFGNRISDKINQIEHATGNESTKPQMMKLNVHKYWKNEFNLRKQYISNTTEHQN